MPGNEPSQISSASYTGIVPQNEHTLSLPTPSEERTTCYVPTLLLVSIREGVTEKVRGEVRTERCSASPDRCQIELGLSCLGRGHAGV